MCKHSIYRTVYKKAAAICIKMIECVYKNKFYLKNRMTTNNTVQEKIARRELCLLELASDLKNVSKACKIIGYLRT